MYQISQHKSKKQKIRLFTKPELENFNQEQIEFAKEQFRRLYAEEMSKISIQLCHQRQVRNNLEKIHENQEKQTREKKLKLKKKMERVEKKRMRELSQKINRYKQNDNQWSYKLKQIQHKFQLQHKEAHEKAKHFREESERYWLKKQHFKKRLKRNNTVSRQVLKYQPAEGKDFLKFSHFYRGSQLFEEQEQIKGAKLKQKNISVSLIDQDILEHKEKALSIENKKYAENFTKAIKKLEKIERNREKKRNKQVKILEPMKLQVREFPIKKFTKKQNQSLSQPIHPKRENQFKRSPNRAQQLKLKQEQIQFSHRGALFQSFRKRDRKQKLRKMISQRIKQLIIITKKKQKQCYE